MQGANILRVHNVPLVAEAVAVADAIAYGLPPHLREQLQQARPPAVAAEQR